VATGAGAASAQTGAGNPVLEPRTPTVTILNKSPDVPAAPATPELAVTPQVPAAAAAPSTPSQPAQAAAPAEPPSPGAPDEPARADAAGTSSQSPEPGESAQPAAADADETAAAADSAEPPPAPTLAIDIDLSRQVMTVSEDGVTRFTWPVSSARYGYRTPTGTYRPTWMAKMWYSRQYDYAPMPHAIFFHKGVAIHGTYAISMLGRPASHGCVRLAPKNAAALFKLVNAHGKARTEIVVHGTPVHTSPRIARGYEEGAPIRRSNRYRYLPPSYAQRGYGGYAPPPNYGRRSRGYYAAPRRQPRGLYNGYSYGYGF
jgi:lipoprotein-anchoring transpeptidase ErfK/SrfK